MADDDPQQLIHKLLLKALSRRLTQSQWLSLLHQLIRRVDSTDSVAGTGHAQDASPLAVSHAVGCLVQYILSQSSIDPLLIEYLQALIYGSANRSGIQPDQGPITDVITATLHLLASVKASASNLPAVETVSSVIGQGLLMTFQSPMPFRVADPSFLVLLQQLFADESTSASVQDAIVAPAALAFVVSNLRLLALAADPNVSAPQNLLAPRVAITVLINVGQSLLAHIIRRLSALQKDRQTIDDALLSRTRAASKTAVTEIDAVLGTMNPAWKDEIALLRSLTSQIGVIEQMSDALSASTSAKTANAIGRKRKAETLQDAQTKATWDHFVDASDPSASRPTVEPEMAMLLHLLVDQHVRWETKLDSVKTLFLARRAAAAPSLTFEKSLTSFYYELLVAAIDACASIVEQPPAFKGAQVYVGVWRNALCGMVPEIVLQLEQWLDVHQNLPLRGQRLEAPHVRVEAALRAALSVMGERLNVCETATNPPAGEMLTDVVGLDTPPAQPIKAWLLRAFIEHSLARPEAIADEFPDGHKLASEVQNLTQSLRMDAQLEGLGLNALFETRITADEPIELLHRVASDPGTHYNFAKQLVLQLQGWLEQHDLESIARWCKALSEDEAQGSMLDIVMVYVEPLEIIEPLGSVLDGDDVGQTSDEPSTLSNILLFLQLLCHRYSIAPSTISRYTIFNHEGMDVDEVAAKKSLPPFLATYFASASVCYPLSALSEDERSLVGRWIHALFGNEGISDDLISASPPTTLLRLSPLLFSQSISACNSGLIDLETLRGGLSYFLQDLLLFALPGALQWLLKDLVRTPVQPMLDYLSEAGLQEGVVDVPSSDGTLANGLPRNANTRTVGLEVLALVLGAEACPGSVREVVAREWEEFVRAMEGDKGLEEGCETFRLAEVGARMAARGVTADSLKIRGAGWVKTVAGADSTLIAWLCAAQPRLDEFKELARMLGKDGGATSAAEQKAVAAWISLLAPTVRGAGVHPVLDLVRQFDFAQMDEGSVEPVIRVLGLILSLVKAIETVRGTSASHDEPDAAAMLLALANQAATPAAETSENEGGGDLFDEEPPAPPTASAEAAANSVTPTASRVKGEEMAVAAPSAAALLTAPTSGNVTSQQVQDLIALQIVRFKAGLRGPTKGQAVKWETLDEAVVDYLAEEADDTTGAKGLVGIINSLTS